MFKQNIILLDTDTLSTELLEICFANGSYSLVFIWDEDLFKSRFFSQKKKEFIYEALLNIKDIVLIEGNSQSIIEHLQTQYQNSQLFYASRFKDRALTQTLKNIEMTQRVPLIKPLPKGFFGFYKKLIKRDNRAKA